MKKLSFDTQYVLSYVHCFSMYFSVDPVTSLHLVPLYTITTNSHLALSLSLPSPPSLVMLHLDRERKVQLVVMIYAVL